MNYGARRVYYSTAMKEMFRQISTTMTKPLISRQNVHKLMTEIGGGWYVEKFTKGLPSLSRSTPSKNHKRRRMKLKNYMK